MIASLLLGIGFPIAASVTGNPMWFLGCVVTLPLAMYMQYLAVKSEFATTIKADSPRPDVTATRQWVDEIVDQKTSNCLRVGGEVHKAIIDDIKEIRKDAPAYYLLLGTSKSGRMVGRLLTGRQCGLAISKACAWVGNVPSPLTEEEALEYKGWSEAADGHYNWECIHTMSEEWAEGGAKTVELYAPIVPAIQAKLVEMGLFIFHT